MADENTRLIVLRLVADAEGFTSVESAAQKNLELQSRINKETDTWGKRLSHVRDTAAKMQGLFSGIMGTITKIGAVLGTGLSLDKSAKTLLEYNKNLINLSAQFNKYGVGITKLEGHISSLGKKLSLTREETMGLMSMYEKGFRYASLESAERIFTNIRNITGSNVEAMREMVGAVGQLTSKYPELLSAAENLSNADKKRLRNTIDLLTATGRMSLEESKTYQKYIDQNSQMSVADKERQKAAQEHIESVQKMKKLFEEVALKIGKALLPLFQKIADFLTKYTDEISSVAGAIAKWIVPITLAFKGLSLIKGVGLSIFGTFKSIQGIFGGLAGKGGILSAVAGIGGSAAGGIAGKGKAGIVKTVLGGILGGGSAVEGKGVPVFVTNMPLGGTGGGLSDTVTDMLGMGKGRAGGGILRALSKRGGVLGKVGKFGRTMQLGYRAGVAGKAAPRVLGTLGKIGAGAAKAAKLTPWAIAATAGEMAGEWGGDKLRQKGHHRAGAAVGLAGNLAGVGGYALTGAAIGSMIPVIGTAVGAVAGGLIGVVVKWKDIVKNTADIFKDKTQEISNKHKEAAKFVSSTIDKSIQSHKDKFKEEEANRTAMEASIMSGNMAAVIKERSIREKSTKEARTSIEGKAVTVSRGEDYKKEEEGIYGVVEEEGKKGYSSLKERKEAIDAIIKGEEERVQAERKYKGEKDLSGEELRNAAAKNAFGEEYETILKSQEIRKKALVEWESQNGEELQKIVESEKKINEEKERQKAVMDAQRQILSAMADLTSTLEARAKATSSLVADLGIMGMGAVDAEVNATKMALDKETEMRENYISSLEAMREELDKNTEESDDEKLARVKKVYEAQAASLRQGGDKKGALAIEEKASKLTKESIRDKKSQLEIDTDLAKQQVSLLGNVQKIVELQQLRLNTQRQILDATNAEYSARLNLINAYGAVAAATGKTQNKEEREKSFQEAAEALQDLKKDTTDFIKTSEEAQKAIEGNAEAIRDFIFSGKNIEGNSALKSGAERIKKMMEERYEAAKKSGQLEEGEDFTSFARKEKMEKMIGALSRKMSEERKSRLANIITKEADLGKNIVQRLKEEVSYREERTSLETQLAEQQRQMVENMFTGAGVNAEMIKKQYDAIGNQIKVNTKYMQELQEQASKLPEGSERRLVVEQEIMRATVKQTGLINQQLQMSKQMRDGWVSAIGAMTVGSGRITKIVMDQTKLTGLAVENLKGMPTTGVSGAAGQGYRGSQRFTTNLWELQGRQAEAPYKTFTEVKWPEMQKEAQERIKNGVVDGFKEGVDVLRKAAALPMEVGGPAAAGAAGPLGGAGTMSAATEAAVGKGGTTSFTGATAPGGRGGFNITIVIPNGIVSPEEIGKRITKELGALINQGPSKGQ